MVAPLAAVGCATYAVLADGPWPRLAAILGAAVAVVLGGVILRLERKLRVEVATVRAEQAAEYAAIHAKYSDEHSEFTSHMVGLLDAASERIDIMRGRLDGLESEIEQVRNAKPGASTPSDELARLAGGAEWNDLWPDLSDAPTVVDLVKWDEKNRDLLPVRDEEGDVGESRTA
jgi:hypothetical protein